MMTPTDLLMLFKNITGSYPVETKDIKNPISLAEHQEYVTWLENELLEKNNELDRLRNPLSYKI